MKKKVIQKLIACAIGTISIGSIFSTYSVLADEIDHIIIANKNQGANESGYVFGSVAINGGGFVPGVVFNKSEKGLAYMRTDIGGAYRWNPDEERWVPLTDWVSAKDWDLLGIDTLATDPIETNRVYLVA